MKVAQRLRKSDITGLLKLASRRLSSRNQARIMGKQGILEIQRAWAKATGESLSAHTFPYKMSKGELHVQADHNIFGQQVKLLQKEILQHLTLATTAQIQSLRVRVGRIYWPNEQPVAKVDDVMSPTPTLVKPFSQEDPLSRLVDKLEDLT